MSENLNFAFIGGDKRQINVIKGFAADGYGVSVYGIDDEFNEGFEIKDSEAAELRIIKADNIVEAVAHADVVVLPLPYSSILDAELINTPLSDKKIGVGELFRALSDNNRKLVLAGKVDDRLEALSKIYGMHIIDYMDREELAVLNAIPTAEGAIKIAMDELPITINASECLCIGYGRVGKVLANTLKGLGAVTTVAVRKHRDLAYIKAYGYNGIMLTQPLENPKRYDAVFNTVPARVVDSTMLRALRDDCLIIDLSSKPGGVDFEAAKKLGRNVIWALSLPGKVAPVTAGNIIRDTIMNILKELGIV